MLLARKTQPNVSCSNQYLTFKIFSDHFVNIVHPKHIACDLKRIQTEQFEAHFYVTLY